MGIKSALVLLFFIVCSGNCLKCYECKKSALLYTCGDQEQGELKECDVEEAYCELSYIYEEVHMLPNRSIYTGQDIKSL